MYIFILKRKEREEVLGIEIYLGCMWYLYVDNGNYYYYDVLLL